MFSNCRITGYRILKTYGINDECCRFIKQASKQSGGNEGFVRPKSVLVVTFITDENETVDGKEGENSVFVGDPASWKEALINAKNGMEQAIIVLLLGYV